MICPDCLMQVPYKKACDECVICGKKLNITAEDVLRHGYGEFVREVREGQITLAKQVEDLLDDKSNTGIIIAEGGTGIGKSFAYLIPVLNDYVQKTADWQKQYADKPETLQ